MAKRKPTSSRRPGPRAEVLKFLEEIKQKPKDDSPRLALAEWLLEHGGSADKARAELIQVQCRLAKMGRTDPERAATEEKEKDLLGQAWSLGDQLPWRSVRGLLHLTCLASTFISDSLEDLEVPEGWAWVESLRLLGLRREVAEVIESPLLEYPIILDLSRERINPVVLETLIAAPRLAHIQELNLYHVWGVEARGLQAVFSSANLAKLNTLCVADSWLQSKTEEGTRDLGVALGALSLPALTSLDVSKNEFGAPGVAALAGAPGFGTLAHLNLAGTKLGGAGLKALLEATQPFNVTSLDLEENGLTDDDLRYLAKSPRVAKLKHLSLARNAVTDDGVKALATSNLGQLTALDLRFTDVGDDGMRTLASAKQLKSLARVRIDAAYRITEDVLSALQRRFGANWNE